MGVEALDGDGGSPNLTWELDEGSWTHIASIASIASINSSALYQEIRTYNVCTNDTYMEMFEPDEIERVKFVAYGIILPVLVALGVLGDLLNLVVLTRPNMTGVAYVYMRGYAAASLFALLCAIPFTHRVLTHEVGAWTSYYVAFFHAHIELYFGNACIGIGVAMLLALTVERFISVCYPAQARNICGGTRRANITVTLIPLIIFVLYSPYLFLTWVTTCIAHSGKILYTKDDNEWLTDSTWFVVYKLLLEIVLKLIPSIILFILNVRIIRTYRAVCKRRRQMTNKVSKELKPHHLEEQRLLFLLGGTSLLFFICMMPMILLSVSIHWADKKSYSFEIFRATANVLEVTNFAVTFYVYCIFSKDFRETFFRTVQSAKDTTIGVSKLKDSMVERTIFRTTQTPANV